MRLHRPWKVPIHMPRGFTVSTALTRVSIPRAALLVKVTARKLAGDARPPLIGPAVRGVGTGVLRLPAPAGRRACSAGGVTAASCSGLRCSRGCAKPRFYRGLRPSARNGGLFYAVLPAQLAG